MYRELFFLFFLFLIFFLNLRVDSSSILGEEIL